MSIKITKTIILLLGLFLVVSSGVLDELSNQDPNSIKFFLGMLCILIAFLRRIRTTIRECF